MQICTFSFGQNHQTRARAKTFFNESTETSGVSSPVCARARTHADTHTELLCSCQFLVYKQATKPPNGLFDKRKTHKMQQRNQIKPFMTMAKERELEKARWHSQTISRVCVCVCVCVCPNTII